jgi:hypothetical protein
MLKRVIDGGAQSDPASTEWATSMQFMSHSRDPRRLQWLLDLVLDAPMSASTTVGLGRRMMYIRVLSFEFGWKLSRLRFADTTVVMFVADCLLPHLAHPYKQVRAAVANLLARLCTLECNVSYGQANPLVNSLIDTILRESTTWDTNVSIRDDPATLARSQYRETALLWLHALVSKGRVCDIVPRLPELLGFLFQSTLDIDSVCGNQAINTTNND